MVVDLDTGLAIMRGTKARCFWWTVEEGFIRKNIFFGPRINIYKREVNIKGRMCVIFYFTGGVREVWGSLVTPAGRLLDLKGRFYAPLSEKGVDCKDLLKAHGYHVETIK